MNMINTIKASIIVTLSFIIVFILISYLKCVTSDDKLDIKLRKSRTLSNPWQYVNGENYDRNKVIYVRRDSPPSSRRRYNHPNKRKRNRYRYHRGRYHKKRRRCRPYIRRSPYDPYYYDYVDDYLPQHDYYQFAGRFPIENRLFSGIPYAERIDLTRDSNEGLAINKQPANQLEYGQYALHFLKAPNLSTHNSSNATTNKVESVSSQSESAESNATNSFVSEKSELNVKDDLMKLKLVSRNANTAVQRKRINPAFWNKNNNHLVAKRKKVSLKKRPMNRHQFV